MIFDEYSCSAATGDKIKIEILTKLQVWPHSTWPLELESLLELGQLLSERAYVLQGDLSEFLFRRHQAETTTKIGIYF